MRKRKKPDTAFGIQQAEILTKPALHHKMEQVSIRCMVSEAEAEWCRENIAAMEKRIPERGESTDEQYRKAVSTCNTVKKSESLYPNLRGAAGKL